MRSPWNGWSTRHRTPRLLCQSNARWHRPADRCWTFLGFPWNYARKPTTCFIYGLKRKYDGFLRTIPWANSRIQFIKTKNGVRTGMCQPQKTISDIRIKLAANECPSRHLWDFQEGEVCFHIIFLLRRQTWKVRRRKASPVTYATRTPRSSTSLALPLPTIMMRSDTIRAETVENACSHSSLQSDCSTSSTHLFSLASKSHIMSRRHSNSLRPQNTNNCGVN